MKCDNLKIDQKVLFVSANINMQAEEVFITDLNDNGDIYIKRNGKTISFELLEDDSEFAFAVSDEEKNDYEDYGFLYLNREIIEQNDKFYDILSINNDKINNLKVEDKLKLMIFLD